MPFEPDYSENNRKALNELGFTDAKKEGHIRVGKGQIVCLFDDDETMERIIRSLPVGPCPIKQDDGTVLFAYALGENLAPVGPDVIDGVTLLAEGKMFAIPKRVKLSEAPLSKIVSPSFLCSWAQTALDKYDATDKLDEILAKAALQRPVLYDVCYSGQLTAIYADANVGKTLFICSGLIQSLSKSNNRLNVYYVNADDSLPNAGSKMSLLGPLGVKTILPQINEFECKNLSELMRKMIKDRQAQSCVIILDTLKKFADVMDKKAISAFNQLCREFAMAGGAVISLVHTNKMPRKDGRPQYGGTADVLQDYDAAYIMSPLATQNNPKLRVIGAECLKNRGLGREKFYFSYSTEKGLSYDALVASVELFDDEDADDYDRLCDELNDQVGIDAIKAAITAGMVLKMEIVQTVSAKLHFSRKAITVLLEKYTGEDPSKHHWRTTRKAHAALVHSLIERPADHAAS